MKEEFALDKPENVERLIQFLQQGGTVQQVYEMADEDIEVMFAASGRYLQQRKLQEAADCFLLLTFLNPYKSKFWMGLGEAYRLSDDFDKAIQTYTMASVYEEDDPRPHFHCAHCLLSKQKPEEARDRLVLALERCRGKDEFSSLQEVCFELVDDINSKIEGGE